MKNVILGVIMLISSSLAFAGEAIIPFWQQNQHVNCTFNISNVSAVDAKVEMRFYKEDGSLYTGPYDGKNGATINQKFTLKAGETARVWLYDPSFSGATLRGFGIITSEATMPSSTNKPFVVAHGIYDAANSSRFASIQINSGLPF